MQDLNDKLTGGTLSATEWNEVPSEIQNVIEGLGITLSSGDLNQLGKAISGYVANGNFYTDSGAADAYVLSTVGGKQAPPAYTDGLLARYLATTDNTGGVATVNLAGLGVKNITNLGGRSLEIGDVVAGVIIGLRFSSSGDRFEIENSASSTVNNMFGLVSIPVGSRRKVDMLGFFTTFPSSSFKGGGQVTWQSGLNKNLANGVTVIDPDTLGGFDGTVSTRDAFLTAQGTGIGSGCWVRNDSGPVNITWGGAVGVGPSVNDAPAVQACVDTLAAGIGGRIYAPTPSVSYELSTSDLDNACVWVSSSNITISGDGSSSLFTTSVNDHVPFHFSDEKDLTVVPSGTELTDFEVYGIAIQGTGVYENFGLAKGRGILFRNVIDVSVHDCLVKDMSMIGIVSEGGDGYFRVQNNQIHGNKYGAINYNGRCYQSIISGNVCSGSNAEVNSVSIQATGHSIITGNTILGDITTPANAGGISWGEGNYDGIGIITNNLVKHVSFGIKAVFHGSVEIGGNTLINCMVQGGISLVSSTTGGFTVANSDNVVSANLVINCQPYGIDCSSEDTLINGNKVRNFTPITNPSAASEPDFIIGATTAQGIRIRGEGCSVTGNHMSGCTHGLTTTIDQEDGIIGGNTFKGNTFDYSLESATSSIFAASGVAIIEREQSSPVTFRERIFRATRPTEGYFDLSSEWTDPTPGIGSPLGEIVLFAVQNTAAVGEPAGETVIELTSTAGWFASASDTVCGIELDNGAWHWTTVTVVASPNITIADAIPVGRTVPVGAQVWYNSWRPLANLA